jgi:hypothetical protein
MTTSKNAMSISQRIAAAKLGIDAASVKNASRAKKDQTSGAKAANEARVKTIEVHSKAK